jgi:uncharacterized membrane-anchored protein
MRRWWILVAVALPVFALALSIASSQWALNSGREWRFAIAGHDPRDLLRGKYLRYNLQLEWESALSSGESSVRQLDERLAGCACLRERGPNVSPLLRGVECSRAVEECDDFVKLSSLRKAERFYVSESQARALEKRLIKAAQVGQAYVVVVVRRNGDVAIKDLLLDGRLVSER